MEVWLGDLTRVKLLSLEGNTGGTVTTLPAGVTAAGRERARCGRLVPAGAVSIDGGNVACVRRRSDSAENGSFVLH